MYFTFAPHYSAYFHVTHFYIVDAPNFWTSLMCIFPCTSLLFSKYWIVLRPLGVLCLTPKLKSQVFGTAGLASAQTNPQPLQM